MSPCNVFHRICDQTTGVLRASYRLWEKSQCSHMRLTSHRCRGQVSRWGLWELKIWWFHKTDLGPSWCVRPSMSAVGQFKNTTSIFCTLHNTSNTDWLTYHHCPDERNKRLCFLNLARTHTHTYTMWWIIRGWFFERLTDSVTPTTDRMAIRMTSSSATVMCVWSNTGLVVLYRLLSVVRFRYSTISW